MIKNSNQINSNQFEIFNCNNWLQQTGQLAIKFQGLVLNKTFNVYFFFVHSFNIFAFNQIKGDT